MNIEGKEVGLLWVKCSICKKDMLWFTQTPLGPSICKDCQKDLANKTGNIPDGK